MSTTVKTRQVSPGRDDVRAGKQANRLALSKIEAADALGVSVDAFEQHVMPSLRTVKVGRRIVIPVQAIEQWLAANSAVYGSARR
jgi:hypothetical protein